MIYIFNTNNKYNVYFAFNKNETYFYTARLRNFLFSIGQYSILSTLIKDFPTKDIHIKIENF
jgi:hypothetical protein